jgi:ribonuclease Z
MELSVHFVGTGGSTADLRRNFPCTAIKRGGEVNVFDVGEGAQRGLLRDGLTHIDRIFITHYHGDHCFGIPGLVKSMGMRDRTAPLEIYGPGNLLDWWSKGPRYFVGKQSFEIELHPLAPDDAAYCDGYRVVAFPTNHLRDSVGYALIEDQRLGKIDVERARALGIEPGEELGQLQAGGNVRGVSLAQVAGKSRPGRRVVYTGDTGPSDETINISRYADVLVHEANYETADTQRARQNKHSTGGDAGHVAWTADVKLLVLNHIGGAARGSVVKQEAAKIFEGDVFLPNDGDFVEVPNAERGDPKPQRRLTDR